MTYTNVDAIVVGAGVCGLTTALCLAWRGVKVTVVAREFPPATSSCAAGAMWGPFLVDHTDAERWARESLAVFRELAADPASGVTMVRGIEAARAEIRPHSWLRYTGDLEVCDVPQLPDGFRSGWRYTTAATDMPVYSRYLLARLRDAGGRIERTAIRSLRELYGRARVIVNCSGGGARTLAADDEVRPMRGRIVVVENPGIKEFFAEHGEAPDLTYFIPHGDRVVLGSTLEPPGEPQRPAPEVVDGIIARCAAIKPGLADARVLESRAGYRPMRRRIRVEPAVVDGHLVIHNYGHGGGGVTVSWGCAHEVAALLEEHAVWSRVA
ncbi:FAD-dependent oxidoreductase [Actinoplanes utahensis]|uniref:D-amino-acid oxidase n=1 Tax=Actinoplanes utahensis TaxID=1869 RepID=A0A0A6WZB1_ACTUT|nr:FAD-dependent oxidoreductase [Actinoplanes utahensis]KHD73097.1 hypothetical protein MB27_36270 [Actinoplanes utahensis]GIF34284.1 amino acid oxidase [Actinoplanes utahensis]